jgi:hypothetical protein
MNIQVGKAYLMRGGRTALVTAISSEEYFVAVKAVVYDMRKRKRYNIDVTKRGRYASHIRDHPNDFVRELTDEEFALFRAEVALNDMAWVGQEA